MKIEKVYLCTDGVDGNFRLDEDDNMWVNKEQLKNIDCKCLLDLTGREMINNGKNLTDCTFILNSLKDDVLLPTGRCDRYKEFYLMPTFKEQQYVI